MTAKTIRAIRMSLGWSQTKLAHQLGVSQPLVSAWESGVRTAQGPALVLLEQLAHDMDVPTASAPKPPREHLLEEALHLLSCEPENGQPERLQPTLAAYQERMEAETDRLYIEGRRRRERRPRLWAYLQQARNPSGSEHDELVHRDAMSAFLQSSDGAAGEMRAWYARQVERVLAEAVGPEEKEWVEVVILAVDAIWFLDLIGLRRFTDAQRKAHIDAAIRIANLAQRQD